MVAVSIALDPSLHQSLVFAGGASAIYGFLNGMFIARALHIRSAAKRAPATEGNSPQQREIVLRTGEVVGY